MVFDIASDPLLRVVTICGIAVFAIALLLLLTIILMRVGLVLEEQRRQAVIARCQPLLLQALELPTIDVPHLGRVDRILALQLWRQLHDSLRGPSLEKLNAVARKFGFDTLARTLLASGNVRDQLLGITTAGLLRDKQAGDAISGFIDSRSPALSLAAARALLLIDAETALTKLLPAFATRADWPIAAIGAMLAEAGPDRVTAPLVRVAMQSATADDAVQSAPRLLRLLELAHMGEASATARFILQSATTPAVIAAALRLLRDPHDLPLLRRYCTHAEPAVRVQTAIALGRLGTPDDRPLLVTMIGDSQWWVRYRAAQALAALPFVSNADLEKLRRESPDCYAADMLAQVIAERAVA